jgi:hypothetical protein
MDEYGLYSRQVTPLHNLPVEPVEPCAYVLPSARSDIKHHLAMKMFEKVDAVAHAREVIDRKVWARHHTVNDFEPIPQQYQFTAPSMCLLLPPISEPTSATKERRLRKSVLTCYQSPNKREVKKCVPLTLLRKRSKKPQEQLPSVRLSVVGLNKGWK